MRRKRIRETGVTDGLLTHAGAPELLPKVFYTNSEYEYWGRAASLIHTTIDGKADAPLMDNVRIYLLAARTARARGVSAHADDRPAAEQPARLPLGDEGAAASRWIAGPRTARRRRPAGIRASPTARWCRSIGCKFPRAAGRQDVDRRPSRVSRRLRAAVRDRRRRHDRAAEDRNGVSDSGAAGGRRRQRHRGHPDAGAGRAARHLHRLESLQRPVGADRRAVEHAGVVHSAGAHGRRSEAPNDPRLSIDERYQDKDQYVGAVSKAALDLIKQRFLLQEDLAAIQREAGRHWDYAVSSATSSTAQR